MNTPVAKLEGHREVFIYEGNGYVLALTKIDFKLDANWDIEVCQESAWQTEFRYVGSLQDNTAIRLIIEAYCGKGEES
jgi:hypothetical protein